MISDLPEKTQPLVVSYVAIRRAIGVSGFFLPVILGPIGWLLFDIDFQENMSSYYHTALRDVFVGTLCSIGIFLFCYKGHDWVENWTANLGCISALGLAFCPLDAQSDPMLQHTVPGYMHTLFGGAFFLTLAFYSLFHFPSSKDSNDEPEPNEQQRDFLYRSTGVIILASVVVMGVYLFILPQHWKDAWDTFHALFWLEWIAIWSFAIAWLTKGRVIVADIAIELVALTGQRIQRKKSLIASVGPSPPVV